MSNLDPNTIQQAAKTFYIRNKKGWELYPRELVGLEEMSDELLEGVIKYLSDRKVLIVSRKRRVGIRYWFRPNSFRNL